jgi:hypothetical protein
MSFPPQVVVHNVKDLEMLMMHNRVFCAEVSQQQGRHTAKELGLIVNSVLRTCCKDWIHGRTVDINTQSSQPRLMSNG